MCKEIMDEIIHDVPLQNTTHDTTEQENKLDPVWHEWTETSIEIPFRLNLTLVFAIFHFLEICVL